MKAIASTGFVFHLLILVQPFSRADDTKIRPPTAADNTKQSESPAPVNEATALVKQLGSATPAQRDAAEKQLKTLGRAALYEIVEGVSSTDSEVAARCAKIAREFRGTEAPVFLAGKKESESPAWKPFKELVGDSTESRKLFAEMMSQDDRAAELEKAELRPEKAHEVYIAVLSRTKEALDQTMKRFMGRPVGDELSRSAPEALRKALPSVDVAAVLFLGRRPFPKEVPDVEPPHWLLSQGFGDGVEGPTGPQMRKLFATWFDNRENPKAISAGLSATLTFAVKEGAPRARRLAQDKKTEPGILGQALLILGHYGTKETDLAILREYRNDERQTRIIQRPGGEKLRGSYQVRDTASAMSLLLSGEDFEAYGFGGDTYTYWHIEKPKGTYRSVSWFEADDARDAALKKAWEWLDRQQKSK